MCACSVLIPLCKHSLYVESTVSGKSHQNLFVLVGWLGFVCLFVFFFNSRVVSPLMLLTAVWRL